MEPADSNIVIVGGGAWGLSTALHLLTNGYTNVTVFDRAEEIPSPFSAAWDLNKIVRAEYEDSFYSNLALEAIEAWKTPLFGPYYHQTGYIVATSGEAPAKAIEHVAKARASIQADPVFNGEIQNLQSAEDFRKYAWQFVGPLTGFKGYYNRLAGYAHSADALRGIWGFCASHGVKFVLGKVVGRVVEIVRSDEGRCVGVKTKDGRFHPADLAICAVGASTASLIPDAGRFMTARCWSIAHVELTEDETSLLRGIPTTNIRDLGFFFEPDPKTRWFKLCPLGIGYTNTDSQTGLSLPPTDHPTSTQDRIPAGDEHKLRRLLQETFPWMADRPFVGKKLCWFSDTHDSDYCIDFVPGTQRSVVCVAGDSGHGFKMMPIFGKWVVALLAAGRQPECRWQWRTLDLSGQDWGDLVGWRVGEGGELADFIHLPVPGRTE